MCQRTGSRVYHVYQKDGERNADTFVAVKRTKGTLYVMDDTNVCFY